MSNSHDFVIEWFPIECRKTKTKVITLANRSRCKQHNEPIRIRSKYLTGTKCGKTRAAKTRLILAWILIADWLRKCREFCEPVTERSNAKQTQNYFQHSIEN